MNIFPRTVPPLPRPRVESDPEDTLDQDMAAMVDRIAVDEEAPGDLKPGEEKGPAELEKFKESEVPEHHCSLS